MTNDELQALAEELFQRASNGDAEAQYTIGKIKSENEDYDEAFSWFMESAEQDYGLAVFEIAESYYFGYGVEEDEDEAMSWYARVVKLLGDAVNSDNENEIEALAVSCYRFGQYHDPRFNDDEDIADVDMALRSYVHAAQLGHGISAHRAARIYHTVERTDDAIEFAEKAIELLDEEGTPVQVASLADAYFILALSYGSGEYKDLEKSATLLGKAAGYGHIAAAFQGGELNRNNGDIDAAIFCYENALEHFDEKVWDFVLCSSQDMDTYREYAKLCNKWIMELKGDSDDEVEYVDYQENFRNSLYDLLESDEFDSLLENTLERAENGDAEAQYMLGKIYQCLGDDYEDEDDDDFDKDESAFYWFAKAAKQGWGLAMFEVAEEYRRGNVVEIDGDAAITWYKMAIEALKDSDEGMKKQAVTDAYLSLALLHEIDLTTEQDGHTIDKKTAFSYMLESAKRGSFVACARVADYYRDGSGTSQDDSQAQIWYEKAVELIKAYGVDNKDLLKRCNTEIEKLKTQQHSKTNIVFPVTYGKTKFESMDDVVRQKGTNPDALGFYSHCCIFGNGVKKNVGIGVEGLFAAANAGSTDAILSLGRLYEYGYEFMRQNLDAAVTLYKYAYSLKNIDALHSLGLILFTSFDKKEIGLSMMRKAAELGSKNANIQLELIQEDTQNVDAMLFDEIPKKEFQYDEFALADHLQLYGIDLEDENAVKNAILEIMSNMPPETFSIIMNEFRTKYLRNRKFSTFHKTINFPAMFDALVADGLVETRKVDDYGATENTIYIAKGSTKKMTSHTLDWDV